MDSSPTRKKLLQATSRFRRNAVFVIGDVMLDEWVWGTVSRISPEAPVPVVQVEKRTYTPGGASNVAANLTSLGARTFLAGVVGDDEAGKILRNKLKKHGADVHGLHLVKGRPTTLKTRIIAHSQQVVRADVEARDLINGTHTEKLMSTLDAHFKELDAILLSDYNKGCLSSSMVPSIVKKGIAARKIVVAGAKPINLDLFSGATLVVLNQSEAEQTVNEKIDSEDTLLKVGKLLLARLRSEGVLITRGEKGMTLFENTGQISSIPARSNEVYDVSGAGDTVVAVATLALSSGASLREASFLANNAAGIVIKKVGTATVSLEELEETL